MAHQTQADSLLAFKGENILENLAIRHKTKGHRLSADRGVVVAGEGGAGSGLYSLLLCRTQPVQHFDCSVGPGSTEPKNLIQM